MRGPRLYTRPPEPGTQQSRLCHGQGCCLSSSPPAHSTCSTYSSSHNNLPVQMVFHHQAGQRPAGDVSNARRKSAQPYTKAEAPARSEKARDESEVVRFHWYSPNFLKAETRSKESTRPPFFSSSDVVSGVGSGCYCRDVMRLTGKVYESEAYGRRSLGGRQSIDDAAATVQQTSNKSTWTKVDDSIVVAQV